MGHEVWENSCSTYYLCMAAGLGLEGQNEAASHKENNTHGYHSEVSTKRYD